MGAGKIFDAFFTVNDGPRQPIAVEYRYGKADCTLEFKMKHSDTWWVFDLNAVMTDFKNKEITYHLGDYTSTRTG